MRLRSDNNCTYNDNNTNYNNDSDNNNAMSWLEMRIRL